MKRYVLRGKTIPFVVQNHTFRETAVEACSAGAAAAQDGRCDGAGKGDEKGGTVPRFLTINFLCVAAMRTDRSVAPYAFFKILPTSVLIGKLFEEVEKIVICTHFSPIFI